MIQVIVEGYYFKYTYTRLNDNIMDTIKPILIMLVASISLSAQTIYRGYANSNSNLTYNEGNLAIARQEFAIYQPSTVLYLNHFQIEDAVKDDPSSGSTVENMLPTGVNFRGGRFIMCSLVGLVQARSVSLKPNLHFENERLIPYNEKSIMLDQRCLLKLEYSKANDEGQRTKERRGVFIGAIAGGLLGYVVGGGNDLSTLFTSKITLTFFGMLTGGMVGGAIGSKYPLNTKQ